MIGVLQAINKLDGGIFTADDEEAIYDICKAISMKRVVTTTATVSSKESTTGNSDTTTTTTANAGTTVRATTCNSNTNNTTHTANTNTSTTILHHIPVDITSNQNTSSQTSPHSTYNPYPTTHTSTTLHTHTTHTPNPTPTHTTPNPPMTYKPLPLPNNNLTSSLDPSITPTLHPTFPTLLINRYDENFDVLSIADPTILPYLVYNYFDTLFEGFINLPQVNKQVLYNYIQLISIHYYNTNQFHNFYHATCVIHYLTILISKLKLKLRAYLPEHVIFAMMIAALVHDVDHPGNTNTYEINSKSDISIIYNDNSILENLSSSNAFKLMNYNGHNSDHSSEDKNTNDTNILNGFNNDEKKEIRDIIITCVLHTDMTTHFHTITELDEFYKSRLHTHTSSTTNNTTNTTSTTTTNSTYNDCNNASTATVVSPTPLITTEQLLTNLSSENQRLLCKLLVHTADLSNPIRIFSISYIWATRIAAEMYDQKLKEEALGLPCSTIHIMQLPANNDYILSKNEYGFNKHIILPLWLKLVEVFPVEFESTLQQLYSNMSEWQARMGEGQAGAV